MPKRKKLPQKRGTRGEGSTLPDKRRGGWMGKVPVGKYDNGRTKYKEVRGKTQAEVVEKKKLILPPDPNAVTVKEWCTRWLAGLAKRPGTVKVYTSSMRNHVLPSLGGIKLKDLTVSQVKAAAQSWVGSKADGKLASQTANLTLDRAATMFGAAVTDGLVAGNPFQLCPRLEYHRKPIDPFTPEELRRIIAARKTVHCGHLFAFLACTGCRVGEGSALDVTDFDPATGSIRITKTFSANYTGMGPPKSKNSRRTLALPALARTVVEEAIDGRTSGVMFRNSAGRRATTNNVGNFLPALLKSLELRNRTSHAMRHSCATALISAGVPLGDVAKWLGDSVSQVVKTYLHPTKFDVGRAMGEILGG